jgi:putative transposase
MEIPFLIVNDLLGESNQISSKPRCAFYVCRLVMSVGMRVRGIALRTRLPACHAHELTFNCFHRSPFLSRDRVCEWLAASIRTECVDLEFSLWAFVFMPDHVHLIVHPTRPAYDVAEFLSQVKQPTSRKALAFLRREFPEWVENLKVQRGQRTECHFWQPGGGFDRNITEPSTLEKMIDYVHLNPVRKGLVAQPDRWKWSSARYFLSGEQLPSLAVTRIPPEWTVGMSSQ